MSNVVPATDQARYTTNESHKGMKSTKSPYCPYCKTYSLAIDTKTKNLRCICCRKYFRVQFDGTVV